MLAKVTALIYYVYLAFAFQKTLIAHPSRPFFPMHLFTCVHSFSVYIIIICNNYV